MTISSPKSTRQFKAGALMQKILSEILMRQNCLEKELKDIFITITQVKMSKDLKVAYCYVVPFNSTIDKYNLISSLKKVAPLIRNEANKEINFKYSPEIRFIYDESYNVSTQIYDLLND